LASFIFTVNIAIRQELKIVTQKTMTLTLELFVFRGFDDI